MSVRTNRIPNRMNRTDHYNNSAKTVLWVSSTHNADRDFHIISAITQRRLPDDQKKWVPFLIFNLLQSKGRSPTMQKVIGVWPAVPGRVSTSYNLNFIQSSSRNKIWGGVYLEPTTKPKGWKPARWRRRSSARIPAEGSFCNQCAQPCHLYSSGIHL